MVSKLAFQINGFGKNGIGGRDHPGTGLKRPLMKIMVANSLVKSALDNSKAYCLSLPFEPIAGILLPEMPARSWPARPLE